jgi:hypothetical protein
MSNKFLQAIEDGYTGGFHATLAAMRREVTLQQSLHLVREISGGITPLDLVSGIAALAGAIEGATEHLSGYADKWAGPSESNSTPDSKSK